jgi:hypothetical protein
MAGEHNDRMQKLLDEASPLPWASEAPSKERATIHHIIRERGTGPQVANVLLKEDAALIVAAINALPKWLDRDALDVERLAMALRNVWAAEQDTSPAPHHTYWRMMGREVADAYIALSLRERDAT